MTCDRIRFGSEKNRSNAQDKVVQINLPYEQVRAYRGAIFSACPFLDVMGSEA